MNKKNILQNLLRRALTPAGTNMKRWAVTLAVVMISLLAPTTVAWADGEEPQQSKPTYQLTSGDGIVHFFLKEGYKSTEVTEAPEGATIVASPDFDMIPAGKYATGEYTSDQVMVTPALDEDTGMPKNTSDGQFTMPAMAVTVSAVLAPQEEYTIYLTTATPQTIPESMWILLNSLEQYYVYDDKTYEIFLDLNLDGKRDVLLTEDPNEATGVSTYSVVRQAGADDIDEDLRFPLTYVHNLQYNSVLFKLSKEAVQSGWITVADGTAAGMALVYNGQAQTPEVIVKDGETDVTSDFDVTYSNNKNACEATADNAPTVTVTAKATSTSYKGSATKTFTINKKPITVTAENKSMAIGGTEPVLTYTIEGLVEGDNVTIELQRTEDNDAGIYDITLKSISGDDNYSVTFVKGTFTIKKEANISVKNPENLAKDGTIKVYLGEMEYAPSEKKLAYNFTPVSGVTVDAVIKIALEPTSGNKAIYKVTDNYATKLTFGDVEWKESGALLTRPKNLTFSGAAVDATNIKFTNALTISANSKMTLVEDFGSSVGTITGRKYMVGTAFEGEGRVSLKGSNLIFTTKTEAGISETHKTVMATESSEATITFNDCQMTASPNGLALASNAGADGVATFASIGGGTSRAETGVRAMARGDKAARPFFSISYSGARIMGKAGDVELQAAEETQAKARGAAEQDITIESGKTYDILTDEDLILTLKLSEGDILITSITLIVPEDSDPNDINGDGDVNAVDLVKAIAAGKTQAEIDAIVNSIMGK